MPNNRRTFKGRYGLLIVDRYFGKNSSGNSLWLCKCDCGNEAVVAGQNLSTGATKSCGCLRRRKKKDVKE